MMNHIFYITAIMTLVLSLIVMMMTLTRLHCGECKRTRAKYTLVLLTALATGLQPYFFSQLPGLSNVLLILSILWLLVDGTLSMREHKRAHLHKDNELIDIVIDKG